MKTLPVELVREILGFLKPTIISPKVAEGAIWLHGLSPIPNWWSRGSQSIGKGDAVQYREVLPLRL
jgi:hypothetical protein